jgi:nucleotide-binding universal stress UspA family protein
MTKTILLATDLAARGDRPLDRAVQLARAWGARLNVLHVAVLEREGERSERLWDGPGRRFEDRAAAARRRIAADLGPDDAGLDVAMDVRFGRPGPEICAHLADHPADLVVTGVARDETLGRRLLGDTVDHLLLHAATPLLVVRQRVHGPYARALVTTDFSTASAAVVARLAALLPDCPKTLVHGYPVPFSGVLMGADERTAFQASGQAAADAFLAGLDDTGGAARGVTERIVAPGDPAALVRTALAATPGALVVAGSHGASGLFDRLLGSTARRLIDETDGDLLLIPDGRRTDRG